MRLRKLSSLVQSKKFMIVVTGMMLAFLSGCTQPTKLPSPASITVTPLIDRSEPTLQPMTPTMTKLPDVTLNVAQLESVVMESTENPPLAITSLPTDIVTRPATATPVSTSTPTASPTAEPDRTCPATKPLKPEYDRYFLAAERWPAPQLEVAEPHFWLSKPLPGAGRTLINQRFPYGWDESGRLLLHNGVDIAEKLGTPVLAVADGTVVMARSDMNAWYGWRCDWYGHLVVIELDKVWHGQPIYVLYGHVLNLMVEEGELVTRGQPLAEVGFGGAATNPHLHLEVRVGQNEFGATRNPMLWIDPGPTRGVIVGRLVDPEGRPWQGVPLALVGRNGTSARASTWSYLGDPQQLANADEYWAENFVFSDVKPGDYDIYTTLQGIDYRQSVTVTAGGVAEVAIETEPLKIETPGAQGSAVPLENYPASD